MEVNRLDNKIGAVPKDWLSKPLSALSHFITKGSTPTTYGFKWEQSGILFLRSECVSENGLDLSQSMYISNEAHRVLLRSEIRANDLLITITGNVGRVVFLKGSFPAGNINQHIARIRIVNEVIDKKYVYHYLSQIAFRKYFNSIVTGQAYPQISLEQVRGATISLPPTLKEQTAIATALSDADALITSLEKLIAKKRNIKQGVTQQLLTGKKRLDGFKGDWEMKELRELVDQFIVPMRDKPKRFTGEIPWCRIEDFDGKYLSDSKSEQYVDKDVVKEMNLKILPIDTLIVSCSADLGRCAIVKKPLVTNQTFIGLVVNSNKASNEFLFYYMTFHAEELNNLSSGTTISYLSREQFESFEVKVPQTKKEQEAIAAVLSDMDLELDALGSKLEKYRQIKSGMMQNLLTGKIRLV